MRDLLLRRDFLRSGLGLTGVYPLCCLSPELPPSAVLWEKDRLLLDLTAAAPLKRIGSAASVADPARKVNLLVIRSGKNQFAALDRTCTHGGAMCAYQHRTRTLRCTSLNHAEYDLQGTLLHGRTHGNLRSYPVRRKGKTLEILLEGRG